MWQLQLVSALGAHDVKDTNLIYLYLTGRDLNRWNVLSDTCNGELNCTNNSTIGWTTDESQQIVRSNNIISTLFDLTDQNKMKCTFEYPIYSLGTDVPQYAVGYDIKNYNIYNLTIYNDTYPIKYQIEKGNDIQDASNRVNSIILEQERPALLVNVSATSCGKLIMEIPRLVVDAKKQGTSIDNDYVAFIDGKNMTSNVRELNKDFGARTIAINFDNSTELIEILGSKKLPAITNDTHVIEDAGIQNLTVGIVAPTFTAAAYSNAFYNFYQAFDYTPPAVKNITTNLDFLTGTIPKAGSAYRLLEIVNYTKEVLPEANVSVLTDQDVDEGKIFETSRNNTSSNIYDLLILGHQEYVTQKEYANFKNFVANGGVLVLLDANVFMAEVSYDNSTNAVTLVKGHNWAFNGKTAWRSVNERWSNETQDWVGSNFYYWGGNTNINLSFTNNPFGYIHNEEQYITNPKVRIIHDYGAVVQEYYVIDNVTYNLGYPRPIIATYQMDFHNGKVIVLSIYSDDVITNDSFKKFFATLLLNYTKIS